MDSCCKSSSIRDRCVAERSTYRPIRHRAQLLALAAADDFRYEATFRPGLWNVENASGDGRSEEGGKLNGRAWR